MSGGDESMLIKALLADLPGGDRSDDAQLGGCQSLTEEDVQRILGKVRARVDKQTPASSVSDPRERVLERLRRLMSRSTAAASNDPIGAPKVNGARLEED